MRYFNVYVCGLHIYMNKLRNRSILSLLITLAQVSLSQKNYYLSFMLSYFYKA